MSPSSENNNVLQNQDASNESNMSNQTSSTMTNTELNHQTNTATQSANQTALNETANQQLNANIIELLAEKPEVNLERVVVGNVRLSKQVKTQTVNVPVTLTQEVLIIEHNVDNKVLSNQVTDQDLVQVDSTANQGTAKIIVNGEAIELTDKPLEIVISQQVAKVQLQTIINETVKLTTESNSHETNIPVTLRHEELVTEEIKLDEPKVISTSQLDEKDFTMTKGIEK